MSTPKAGHVVLETAFDQLEMRVYAQIHKDFRKLAKSPTYTLGYDVGLLKDVTVMISTMRCPSCNRQVQISYMDKHKAGKECQLGTAIQEMALCGYYPVKRQQVPILKDFGIEYKEKSFVPPPKTKQETFKETYARLNATSGPMPYVFVQGWMGALCCRLVSRPLRWALTEIQRNQDFKEAIESITIIDENDSACLDFVVNAWNNRKGKHKNASVRAYRSGGAFV